MSSDGKVHVGAIACRELVPQPWKLTEQFPAELDALHAAATSGRKPKATAKKSAAKKKQPAKKAAAKKKPAAKKQPAKKAAKKSG